MCSRPCCRRYYTQGRVQALCLEVGVPFGGHGRSSSQMSAGELDAQLQAVEKALGI